MADTVDLTDELLETLPSNPSVDAPQLRTSRMTDSNDEIDLTLDSPRELATTAAAVVQAKSQRDTSKDSSSHEDDICRKRIMAFASSVAAKRQRTEAPAVEAIAPALAAVTIHSSTSNTSSSPTTRRASHNQFASTIPQEAQVKPEPSKQDPAAERPIEIPPANRLLAELHAERVARQKTREAALQKGAAATASEEAATAGEGSVVARNTATIATTAATTTAAVTGIAAPARSSAQVQVHAGSAAPPVKLKAQPPAARNTRGKAAMPSSNGNHNRHPSANNPSAVGESSRAAAPTSRGPGETSRAGSSGGSTTLTEFDVLTYNVWFNQEAAVEARMKGIADIVKSHDYPCFICLQEVTPLIMTLLSQMPFWRHYAVSPTQPQTYFTLLLCHKEKVKPTSIRFFYHSFANSVMARGLLGCHCEVAGTSACISTTHLESPCGGQLYSEARRGQLKTSLELLEKLPEPNMVLAGDTNWNVKDGPMQLGAGWQDVWAVQRPGDPGLTYNSRSNAMLQGSLSGRLDRVLCKATQWEPHSIQMVGTEPIPNVFYNKEFRNGSKKRLQVLPSDHYGLLTKFVRKS